MIQPDYPYKDEKLLLLSCCAPCSIELIKRLSSDKVNVTVLFYNPNIHPEEEYILRKDENKEICNKYNIKFIDLDYDAKNWFNFVKGLENEPEKGKRCSKCFEFRLLRTAEFAKENGFRIISSTLDASRWKSKEQVHDAAKLIVDKFDDMLYYTLELRKGGTQQERLRLIKEESLYEQKYCGCVYSKKLIR
ncbi:MAG: epoxyqueuosine reductase QueH [Proteobacteria bacterium]|nr:epoxyqueuosine reductase QueH [Pseudomonadota bacterium]